jgi:hypothetical protein
VCAFDCPTTTHTHTHLLVRRKKITWCSCKLTLQSNPSCTASSACKPYVHRVQISCHQPQHMRSTPPHPLLGPSGHHRTLRTATTSQQHRACMCRKPFSTTCGHVMGPLRNLRSLLSIAVMAIAQLCPSPLCVVSVQGVEASSSRPSLIAVCL